MGKAKVYTRLTKFFCAKQFLLPDNVSPQGPRPQPQSDHIIINLHTQNFRYSWFVTGTTSKVSLDWAIGLPGLWSDCKYEFHLISLVDLKQFLGLRLDRDLAPCTIYSSCMHRRSHQERILEQLCISKYIRLAKYI